MQNEEKIIHNFRKLCLTPGALSLAASYHSKGMKMLGLLLLGCLLLAPAISAADDNAALDDTAKAAGKAKAGGAQGGEKEIIYIVNAYRYEPDSSGKDSDIGQALCGTRCNALSVDYQNYLKPPGWRIIRTASNKEVAVDLNNPFIDGRCICIADEYIVRVNELYMVK
jgi:hypothetical protein